MKKIVIFITLLLTGNFLIAQNFKIEGKIFDKENNTTLSFANLQIKDMSIGTATNTEGSYQINLPKGNYKIVVSYIGYKSDTQNVNLIKNLKLNFYLKPASIELEKITVTPGINPAIEIIRKTCERKRERERILNSYIFDAYTKGVFRTNQKFLANQNSASLNLNSNDTGKLEIAGIIENQSKGYYQKPNKYKEEIIARKQSANIPASINFLTGGRIIQNFYSDDIQFFGNNIPSPIGEDALNYYYYYIEDTLAFDNQKVFKIYFATENENDPGFLGNLYIIDKEFFLAKLNIYLNAAANPGGIFSEVNIFQQFQEYKKNIFMPVDYRLFIKGNILGLAKFDVQINSVLTHYKINTEMDNDIFNIVILKILPDADKKDSLYWMNNSVIPNTLEEKVAYNKIDSLQKIERTFWERFSFLSTEFSPTENISLTAPLGLYHFNKVEGSALNIGLWARNLFDNRFYSGLELNYGFSDKKVKSEIYANYYLGKYRSYALKIKVYNSLSNLFEKDINHTKFTSTVLSLFSKYDFRDYYYSKGFKISLAGDIFPVLALNLGFENRKDKNATNNTKFSFFKRDKEFATNRFIDEGNFNILSAGFVLDFRKIIEDVDYKRRTSLGKSYAVLKGNILYSNSNFIKSDFDFEIYKLSLFGKLNTINSLKLDFRIKGIYSEDVIPYQMLFSLPGNIDNVGTSFSFRTLKLGEIVGNQIITANFEHNFGGEIFRFLGLSLINKWHISVSAHCNMAFVKTSSNSKNILKEKPTEFLKPFYEAGFGIGHILMPIKLEFTWKLNYRGKNNFVIGINTPII